MAVPGPGDKDKKKKNTNENSKTTVGKSTIEHSKSRITGEDGQVGVRRSKKTTTPIIKKTEFTPEGNKAYAAKSKTDRIAQDKAWTKMSQSKDVKVTNIDNFGVRNVQPEGIKPLGSDTKSPKIEIAKGAPRPKAMYEVRGSNIHNMKFGGHSSTQLTDDPNFKGDTSHRLSPSNPISGKPNTSSVTRLSDNVAAAMNTPYNRGRTSGFSEEQATKVNAKEEVRQATISARKKEINKRKKANTERVKANRNK